MSLSRKSLRNASLRDLSEVSRSQRFNRHSSIYMSLPMRKNGDLTNRFLTGGKSDEPDIGQTVGYCYLRLFHVLFFGDENIVSLKEEVARKLGVYPLLRDVFLELISVSIDRKQSVSEGFLPELKRVSKNLFHVERIVHNVMTIDDFVKLYSKYFSCRIGSDDNKKKKQNYANLRTVAERCGVEYDVLLGQMLRKQMTIPTNFEFQQQISQDVQNLIEAHRRLPDQKIDNILDKDQQQIILRLFGERYGVVFTQRITHPHAMADSIRQLERLDLMNIVSYSFFQDKNPNLDAQVINVGGNYANAFNREWVQMHNCCPLIDARDQARNVVRRNNLQKHKKLTKAKRVILQDIVDSKDPLGCKFFCHRKSEDCKQRSNAMIFCHSAYDMTTTQIADAMESHGVDVAHAVMVFDESMLTDSIGRVDPLGMNWRRYDEQGVALNDKRISGRGIRGLLDCEGVFKSDANRKYCGGTIEFWFDGPGNEPYIHDFGVFISKFTVSLITSSKGTVYKAEQANKVAGGQRITWVRINDSCNISSSFMWNLQHQNNRLRVRYYVFDRASPSKNLRKLKVAYVNQTFYQRIHDYAISQKDGKFTLHDLLTFAISQQYYVMINAKTIRENTTKDFNADSIDLLEVVCAIYCYAYVLRNDVGDTLKKQVEKIKEYREKTSTTLSTIYNAIKRKFDMGQSEFWDMLCGVFSFEDKYMVEITSMPTEIKYTTSISGRLVTFESSTKVSNYSIVYPDNQNIDVEFAKNLFAPLGSSCNVSEQSAGYGVHCNDCLDPQKKLTTIKIKGDGNCFFYALMTGLYGYGKLGNDVNVTSFKKSLIYDHDLFMEHWRHILETDLEWGETNMSVLVAEKYEVNVCVHKDVESDLVYHVFNLNHPQTIHLLYNGNHFDLLWIESNNLLVKSYSLVVPSIPFVEGTPSLVASGGADNASLSSGMAPSDESSMTEESTTNRFLHVLDNNVNEEQAIESNDVDSPADSSDEADEDVSESTAIETISETDGVDRLKILENFLDEESKRIALRGKNRAKKNTNVRHLCEMAVMLLKMTYDSWRDLIKLHCDRYICTCCVEVVQKLTKCCEKYYKLPNNPNEFLQHVRQWYPDPLTDSLPRDIHNWIYNNARQPYGTYRFIFNGKCMFVNKKTLDVLTAIEHFIQTKQVAKDLLSRCRVGYETKFSQDKKVDLEVRKMQDYLNQEKMTDMFDDTKSVSTAAAKSEAASSKVSGSIVDMHKNNERSTPVNNVLDISFASTLGSTLSMNDSIRDTYKCIDSLRLEISRLDDDLYSNARKSLRHPKSTNVVNYSQMKIEDIFSNHFRDVFVSSALDLCSAPGGFVSSVRSVFKPRTIYFHVYTGDNALQMHDGVIRDDCIRLTNHADGDLTNVVEMSHVISQMAGTLVDLVTADGFVSDAARERDNESVNCDLIRNEVTIALSCLKVGGSLVIKFFDFRTSEMRNVLKMLHSNFEKVLMTRTKFSSPVGGEVYFICLQRRAKSEFNSKSYKSFYRAIAKIYCDEEISRLNRFISHASELVKKKTNKVRSKMASETVAKIDEAIRLKTTFREAVKSENEKAKHQTTKEKDERILNWAEETEVKNLIMNDRVAVVMPVACGKSTFAKKFSLIDTEHLTKMTPKLLRLRDKAHDTGDYSDFNKTWFADLRNASKNKAGIYLLHHQEMAEAMGIPVVAILLPSTRFMVHVRTLISGHRYSIMTKNIVSINEYGGEFTRIDDFKDVEKELLNVVTKYSDDTSFSFWEVFSGVLQSDPRSPSERISKVSSNSSDQGVLICAADFRFETRNFERLQVLPSELQQLVRIYYKEKHFKLIIEARTISGFNERLKILLQVMHRNVCAKLGSEVHRLITLQSSPLATIDVTSLVHGFKYVIYEERTGLERLDILANTSIENFYDRANADSRSHLYGKDSTKYEIGHDIATYCRNAMREYYNLCRMIHINKQMNYDKAYKFMKPLMTDDTVFADTLQKIEETVKTEAEGFGLYDLTNGKYVIKPKEMKCFEKGYDGQKFVNLQYKDNGDGNLRSVNRKDILAPNAGGRYIVVGKSSELMQDSKIYTRLENWVGKIDSFIPGDLKVVIGTPGCGKSTTIAKSVDKSASSMRGDLVITPSSENAANLREKVNDIHNNTKYRTDDSYLMNVKDDERVWRRLIVDEAMMAPFGKTVFIMMMCEAKEIILYGDPYQLPYILRLPTVTSVYQKVPVDLMPKQSLNVSMCVPQCITKFFNITYADVGGYKTRSKLLGEIEMIKITNEQEVRQYKKNSVVYLTFKQSEKKVLLDKFKGDNPVFTIHEYQGKRSDHIVLVRLSSRINETLYSSDAHILVAFTRAIKKFTYYTPLLNDSVALACQSMMNMSLDDTRDVFVRESGGAKFEDLRFDISEQQRLVNERGLTEGVATKNLYALHVTAQCIERPLSCGRAISARLDARNGINCNYFSQYENADDYSHIVSRFGLINSPFFEVKQQSFHPMLDEIKAISTVPLWKCHSPVNVLQDAYDNCMQGYSIIDDKYWLYDAAHCDLEMNFDNVKLDTMKDCYRPKMYDNLTPVLRTLCPRNRVCNQRELMVNYKYRNEASAELASSNVAKDDLVDLSVKSFCEAYLVPNYEEKIREYKEHPLAPSDGAITRWVEELKLRGKTVRATETMSALFKNLQEFTFGQKEKAKVFTNVSKALELPTLQTISYQGDDMNAFFCPMSKGFKERLMAIMKPQFMLFFDISPENFAKKFQENLGVSLLDRKSMEFDISKFDQSITLTDLEILVKIMGLMGIVEEVAVYYLHTMTVSHLVNRQEGFKGTVHAQQKSGHAFTLPFNTTMTMAALATVIDMSKIDGGVFCGDDSLLFMPEDSVFRNDVSHQLEEMFNFEVKLEQYDHALFCSKFLLNVQGRVVFVPDVLKLITKLGRKDLVDKKHVEDYRQSLMDLTKDYTDAAVAQVLSDALNQRYKVQMEWSGVLAAIIELVNDKETFSSLWYLADGDVPFSGSVRPDLEM